jgi:photosystem II stability/assembly factor-like uncharacterized protein
MTEDTDLERRLRTHMEAERTASPAPPRWETRIMHAVRATPSQAPRHPLRQVAFAGVLIVFAATLAGATVWFRSLGVNRQAVKQQVTAAPKPSLGPTGEAVVPAEFTWLRMVSPTAGWAVVVGRSKSLVVRTDDAGQHWRDVSPAPQLLPTATFARDTNIAWVAYSSPGGAFVYRTIDGGRTWERSSRLPTDRQPSGWLDFIDGTHGWFVAITGAALGRETSQVFRTTDGGSDWALMSESQFPEIGPSTPGSLPTCDLGGAVFLNATTGWVGGTCTGPGPALWVTHDAGRTWRAQPLPAPPGGYQSGTFFNSPNFFSAVDGAVVMQNGSKTTIYATNNAGQSWTSRSILPSSDIHVAFLDASHWWYVDGGSRQLFQSTDAGRHWSLQGTISTVGIDRLQFVNEKVGFTVQVTPQGQSHLLQTADGGRSWAQIPATFPPL